MNPAGEFKYDVVGVGRSYIDVIGHAPYAVLERFGIPLGNSGYYDVEQIDAIIASLQNPAFCPGGIVANTLAGIAALGGKAGTFSKVARDEAGQAFQNDSEARSIDALCAPFVSGAPKSGTCVVLITDCGERSFALHKGCVDAFSDDDFGAFDFGEARYFVVAARLLADAPNPDVFLRAIERAAQTRCRVVLTLSEVRDWHPLKDMMHDVVLPCVSVLVGNVHESEGFVAEADKTAIKRVLLLTTLGEQGVIARQYGQEERVAAVPPGKFENTLGAGDQFLAGFLKGQAIGMNLKQSLELAARCASAILQETTARPAIGEDWSALI